MGNAQADSSFRDFKDHFYVSLASKMLVYNWLIVAVTAASPILDSSYLEKGKIGESAFNGMSSVRCSEMGYWNFFTPVLDYSSIEKYADSILGYIEYGMIRSESELYFPIRLKPAGKYSVAKLKEEGVSHIELRMIDLNPYRPEGLDVRDAEFIKLLLIYLAALSDREITPHEQIQAVKNTKNAAHYDISMVKIVLPASEEALKLCRGEKISPADSYMEKGAETTDLMSAALCVIGNVRFARALNADRAALIGLYHDASEIITGDMPTPVKYYNSDIRDAYKEVEHVAEQRLLWQLPDDLRSAYAEIFNGMDSEEDRYMRRLVKAADKLSALIKCMEETGAGNGEFRTAQQSTQKAVEELAWELPEVKVFLEEFLPPYGSTLDELLGRG